MNTKRLLCSLTALLLLWGAAPVRAFAETRDIYVGDIITLKVTARGFSAEELKDKFQNFEIVEIKNEPDGYLLSLRTFETGEQIILLGDNEIVINVQSTLDAIQREDIYEGEARVINGGFPFYWRVLFYIAAVFFGLSGGFVLFGIYRKRKIKPLSALQLFLRRCESLSAGDDNYFVDLTFYFKEYLESLFQFRIIGKTSAEIVNELKRIQALDAVLPEIKEWLTECDRLKFTGVTVSTDEKQSHYGKLNNLVEKIQAHREAAA